MLASHRPFLVVNFTIPMFVFMWKTTFRNTDGNISGKKLYKISCSIQTYLCLFLTLYDQKIVLYYSEKLFSKVV